MQPTVDLPFWLTRGWLYRTANATLAIWIGTALAFASTVIVARSLGPAGYGSVIMAVSLLTLITTVLDLTLEEAIVFYGSGLIAENDGVGLRRLLSTALRIDVLNGLIVFALVLSLADGIAEFLAGGDTPPSLLRIAAVQAFATTANGTTGAMMLLVRRPELRAWMTSWTALTRIVAVLVALTLHVGPSGVLWAFAAAAAVSSVCQGFVAWHVTRPLWANATGGAASEQAWLRPLVSFSIHTGLATSVLAGRGALIPVIFGRIAGARALGLFNAAMLPVSAASIADGGLRMSLFTEQAAMYAKRRWARLRRSVRGHIVLGFAVGIPAAMIGYILMPWLITTLYSPAYSASASAARILLVTAVVYLALGWTKTLPAAVGRPGLRTAVGGFDLGVSALLVWALAERGAVGAASAIALSSVLLLFAWLFVLRSILLRSILANTDARQGGTDSQQGTGP